jgi:hypothetical protein
MGAKRLLRVKVYALNMVVVQKSDALSMDAIRDLREEVCAANMERHVPLAKSMDVIGDQWVVEGIA